MKLSFVIPVYNEEAIVGDTIAKTHEYLRVHFPDSELIIVDDGSIDGTRKKAAEAADKYKDGGVDIRVIGYKQNRGKGCAVRTGMLEANGSVVFFTDCDLAYGLDITAHFVSACETADVAIGSRPLHPDGYSSYTFLRKLMSKTYLGVIKLAAGFKYSDSQSGIKAFSQKAAKDIFSRCKIDGFAFDLEALILADKLGYSVKEVPVTIINHRGSHIRLVRDTLNMLHDIRIVKKRIKTSI